jgi:hypothetical protein
MNTNQCCGSALHSSAKGILMKPLTLPVATAWMAAATLLVTPALWAADALTHIPPDTTETDLQQLTAPTAGDLHRLWNQGTLGNSFSMDIIRGTGAGQIQVDNEGTITGTVDFSGVSGNVIFDNTAGAVWRAEATEEGGFVRFGGGDDQLRNAADGRVDLSMPFFGEEPLLLDFGGGDDNLINHGTMFLTANVTGLERIENHGGLGWLSAEGIEILDNFGEIRVGRSTRFAEGARITNHGALRITEENAVDVDVAPAFVDASGIERFENQGLIQLGLGGNESYVNRLILDGADFVASGDSRLSVGVLFADAGQSGCALTATGVADCLSIQGGTTTGTTTIEVLATTLDKGATYLEEGIVLVDVRGGESAAEHFVLDPASTGYEAGAPLGGGLRADEMFTFHLLYDEATQTHRLMGLPDLKTQVIGVLPTMAQRLWRSAASASVARQSALRAGEQGGGLWFQLSDVDTERDARMTSALLGNPLAVAVRHEQQDRAYSLGADLVSEQGSSRYTLGFSVGDVSSEFVIDRGAARADVEAISYAVYAGAQRGRAFLDLAASGYSGELDGQLALQANDYTAYASIDAVGGRVDGGWQLAWGDRFALTPLLSVVYIRSDVGPVQHLSGNKNNAVILGAASSLRAGAGAQAAMTLPLAALELSLSLSVHAWEELKGDAHAHVRTVRDPFPFSSTLDGRFTEVDAEIGLGDADGTVSGYLRFGGQYGDEETTAATAGLRYRW